MRIRSFLRCSLSLRVSTRRQSERVMSLVVFCNPHVFAAAAVLNTKLVVVVFISQRFPNTSRTSTQPLGSVAVSSALSRLPRRRTSPQSGRPCRRTGVSLLTASRLHVETHLPEGIGLQQDARKSCGSSSEQPPTAATPPTATTTTAAAAAATAQMDSATAIAATATPSPTRHQHRKPSHRISLRAGIRNDRDGESSAESKSNLAPTLVSHSA